ncbi:hypothetical protein A9Q86_03880 [Flavobacteriales bacterium 33_180_T64]|nr:hypothetical protein A9Q86_03880 [Flavobacteriales bacterium 33_180_T64]
MSEKLPEEQGSEEVDLGQLFSAIGKLFDRFINFIGSIFRSIFSVIVFSLKAVFDNFKIIAGVMIIAAAIGYGLESLKAKSYSSQILVKPYFDSKYQLVNNIDYFNALISDEDFGEISNIFGIDENSAKEVIEFEIIPGPESENQLIQQYDQYLNSLDSIRAQEIDYDQFLENRNIFSSDFFEIKVESTKKDIFKSLENGLNASFENTFSAKKIKKRDSIIFIQKLSLRKSIGAIDSLQRVYIRVLTKESESASGGFSLSEMISLEPEKSNTKEFELHNQKMDLEKQLLALQEKKVEEDVFFDTLSGFQGIGTEVNELTEKYSLIFPILAFLLLILIFLTRRTMKFVQEYGN